MSSANTVVLKGSDLFIRKEALTAAAITPGHLIESYNASGVRKVRVHSTAGGSAQRAFALENYLVGKDLSGAYASGDVVQYAICPRGAEVNALVPASALAIVAGDALESNGDGTVIKHVIADSVDPALVGSAIVGYAMEAIDNHSGGTVVRIRMEVA